MLLYTDNVADVCLFESGVIFVAEIVAADVKLYASRAIEKMRKARLAHDPLGNKSARKRNLFVFVIGVIVLDDLCVSVFIVLYDFVRVLSLLDEFVELVASNLYDLGCILFSFFHKFLFT